MKIITSLLFLFLLVDVAFANLCEFKEESEVAIEKIEKFIGASGFSSSKNAKRHFKIYYDTPELYFLGSESSINYAGEGYKSKKGKQKFYENIVLTHVNNKDFFSVKHYKNINGFEEKHPLLVLVKRKDREQFVQELKALGIKYPMRLKKIFKVSDITNSMSIKYKGDDIASLDIHNLLILNNKQDVVKKLIGFEVNEELFSKIPDKKKNELLNYINGKIQCNEETEYKTLFLHMENNVDYFRFLLKYPYLMNLLYSISFAFIGGALLKVLFWRRM